MHLITRLRALVRDAKGQDLLEYALLVALIAVVAIVGITAFGEQLSTFFTSLPSKLGF